MELLFDIILALIILGAALYGFAVGFVHAAASLIGFVFSVIVASHTYISVAQWILPEALSGRSSVQVVVFFLILALITSVVNILVRIINRVFDVIAVIPFTKSLNRLLGLTLGALLGVGIVLSVVYIIDLLPSLPSALVAARETSIIARVAAIVVGFLTFMFPRAADRARDVLPTLSIL